MVMYIKVIGHLDFNMDLEQRLIQMVKKDMENGRKVSGVDG